MRRPFAALACGLLALAGGTRAAADPGAAPLPVTQIAPGVFEHSGTIGDWLPTTSGDVANLGFVIGTRCVAVIDTGGTPAIGQRLRAAVERETKVPICYVIDTHAHPDHILGNAAFAGPATQFVGSAKFNAALSAREPFFRNALQRDFDIVIGADAIIYPTVRVETTLDLDLGGRTISLQAWPTAHTNNDLTVYDRSTRTLFASDLLFIQHMPVIDGKLVGWLAVMADLARIDAVTVVPGHGPVSQDWPGAMAPQRDYLEAVQRETRAAIKAHVTLAKAVDTVATEAAKPWLLADRYHRRNVTAAYAELEWE